MTTYGDLMDRRAMSQFWNLDTAGRLRAAQRGLAARERSDAIGGAMRSAYSQAISGQGARVSPLAAMRRGSTAAASIGARAAATDAAARAVNPIVAGLETAAARAARPDPILQGIGSALNIGGQVLGFAMPMMAPAGQAASATGRDLQQPGSGGPVGGMLGGIISGNGPKMGDGEMARLGHMDVPETLQRVDSALGLSSVPRRRVPGSAAAILGDYDMSAIDGIRVPSMR